MAECKADATWHGSVTNGEGVIALGSDVWRGSYATPDVETATNPEELLAAAHASCFSMTVAFLLEEAGYEVVDAAVDVEAAVTLEHTDTGFHIPRIDLAVSGTVPDAPSGEFAAIVSQAEPACPVSSALDAPEITVSTRHDD